MSAPCNNACPAGIDVPRYVRLIGQDRPDEALAVIRERIPFPSVCGIVCVHPCQAKCRRGQVDEAIAIRELKRYAVEHGGEKWKQELTQQAADRQKRGGGRRRAGRADLLPITWRGRDTP